MLLNWVCVFPPIYRPAKPCTFDDNVSALKLAGLSQVFQEALIRLLCNNGITTLKGTYKLTDTQASTCLLAHTPKSACRSLCVPVSINTYTGLHTSGEVLERRNRHIQMYNITFLFDYVYLI